MLRSGGGQVPLAAAYTQLAHALDVLDSVERSAITDAELPEAVVASRRLLLRLRSLDARIAGWFASSSAWADEARSATGWLTQKTHAGEGETRSRLRLAEDTARHPVMGRAVAAGEVSVEHLRELAKAHRKLPALAAELDAVEGVITDYARTATPAQLRGFLEHLARNIAPDVVDDAEKDRLEDRAHLTVTELLDGWVAVAGMLPPELGGRPLTALRALMLPVTSQVTGSTSTGACEGAGSGTRASASEKGDASTTTDTGPMGDASDPVGAGAEGVPRPLSQRMLDALARMPDYLADARLDGTQFPLLRGHLPLVTVTVPLDELTTQPGDGVASLLTPAPRNPVVISADTARKHACDAVIRRLVLDPAGVPLDVGRRQRTVSSALAAAVQHRDRHCRWPGCRQRIDHAHHVVHWAHGGGTDLPNLLGLCAFHHHVAHTGDWVLHGDANTAIRIRPTGGRGGRRIEMTSRPPDDHHLDRALGALRR